MLEISDDGQGLPARAKRELGIGMLTMTHRARMLGGHCDIANRDGTVVTWPIPNHTTCKDAARLPTPLDVDIDDPFRQPARHNPPLSA